MKHKACYGTIFPDISSMNRQSNQHGIAISVQVEPRGLAPPKQTVTVNIDAWDKCVACDEFETCYRLATARLLVKAALAAN
ncbi:MAG: hypothetical protein QM492_07550 [Rhodobacterales bacterium]